MEMFLMGLALSLLGVAVSALAFGAAVRAEPGSQRDRARTRPTVVLPVPQFFVDDEAAPARPRVPVEVLLLQLERHVRLEQAAAESFLLSPTVESLHTRTSSPLVH